jgi:hypothetical protein
MGENLSKRDLPPERVWRVWLGSHSFRPVGPKVSMVRKKVSPGEGAGSDRLAPKEKIIQPRSRRKRGPVIDPRS